MARYIKLSSGSILNGSPITFEIGPNVVAGGNLSFHRVVLEIRCGITGSNYTTIKMSAPVLTETESSTVSIDISSALRTFRDGYAYAADQTIFPLVKFSIGAYDEYMQNGELHPYQGKVLYPNDGTVFSTIFGYASDIERMKSNGSLNITKLSRKPTTAPHLAFVGEEFVYPVDFTKAQSLLDSNNLEQPQSKIETIVTEGLQNIGSQSVYALPASESEHRHIFRFINSFGMLESISIPAAYSKKIEYTASRYISTRQETFNSFSRSAVRKAYNQETWLYMTDPLTEEWQQWYLQEFLMSEHVWLLVDDVYVPCTISVDDEITYIDKLKTDMLSLSFSVELDLHGSPVKH